ncbi:hypothetical protein F5141DRAFT_1145499 [Pisolithus sp. B1]|nr:hypothetical protein F5141DRAFT_1145499 [Pisolithus sp. B1]
MNPRVTRSLLSIGIIYCLSTFTWTSSVCPPSTREVPSEPRRKNGIGEERRLDNKLQSLRCLAKHEDSGHDG